MFRGLIELITGMAPPPPPIKQPPPWKGRTRRGAGEPGLKGNRAQPRNKVRLRKARRRNRKP